MLHSCGSWNPFAMPDHRNVCFSVGEIRAADVFGPFLPVADSQHAIRKNESATAAATVYIASTEKKLEARVIVIKIPGARFRIKRQIRVMFPQFIKLHILFCNWYCLIICLRRCHAFSRSIQDFFFPIRNSAVRYSTFSLSRIHSLPELARLTRAEWRRC